MKWLIAILASLSIIGVGRAQSVDAFGNLTLTATVNNITNAAPTTFTNLVVNKAVYHTVQVVSTNVATYCVDRSVDGTYYVLGTTNALTAGTVSESTLTQKVGYLRVRVQGTNVGVTLNYIGGK